MLAWTVYILLFTTNGRSGGSTKGCLIISHKSDTRTRLLNRENAWPVPGEQLAKQLVGVYGGHACRCGGGAFASAIAPSSLLSSKALERSHGHLRALGFGLVAVVFPPTGHTSPTTTIFLEFFVLSFCAVFKENFSERRSLAFLRSIGLVIHSAFFVRLGHEESAWVH
jgi:hypothetical protein